MNFIMGYDSILTMMGPQFSNIPPFPILFPGIIRILYGNRPWPSQLLKALLDPLSPTHQISSLNVQAIFR